MKDQGIPFKAEMVIALLREEGPKTQTRRTNLKTKYEVGGILRVREAWKTEARFDHLRPSQLPRDAKRWYLADGPAPEGFGRYRHGRFMPLWASRISLRITALREENLTDISEEDAIAEGCRGTGLGMHISADEIETARDEYKRLWESINGPGSWVPQTVKVITFERVKA